MLIAMMRCPHSPGSDRHFGPIASLGPTWWCFSKARCSDTHTHFSNLNLVLSEGSHLHDGIEEQGPRGADHRPCRSCSGPPSTPVFSRTVGRRAGSSDTPSIWNGAGGWLDIKRRHRGPKHFVHVSSMPSILLKPSARPTAMGLIRLEFGVACCCYGFARTD
jgi:hypothetical protein